jgi:hypothetical protein
VHPRWKYWPDHEREAPEVGCVYYEAPDATVLIDPLVPAGEKDDFFRHLDADVERRDLPVVILLTADWHRRSADELAARYDARIGGTLPAGVEEIAIEGSDERQVAYFIRQHAALVTCEVFAVDVDGMLRACQSPALERPDELEASFDRLMELPVERLLVSHGARPRGREGADGGSASPPLSRTGAARPRSASRRTMPSRPAARS